MDGSRFGNEKWIFQFLRKTKLCKTVRYFSLPADLFRSILGVMSRQNTPLKDYFKNLRTLHLLMTPVRDTRLRSPVSLKIPVPYVVWRVPSFARQDLSFYVSSLPHFIGVDLSNGVLRKYLFLNRCHLNYMIYVRPLDQDSKCSSINLCAINLPKQ